MRDWERDNSSLGKLKERGLLAGLVNNAIVDQVISTNLKVLRSYTTTPTGVIYTPEQYARYSDERLNPSFAPKFKEALLSGAMRQEIHSSDISVTVDIDNNVILMLHGTGGMLEDCMARRGALNPCQTSGPITLLLGTILQGERLITRVVGTPVTDFVEISALIDPSPPKLVVSEELKELHHARHISGVHMDDTSPDEYQDL